MNVAFVHMLVNENARADWLKSALASIHSQSNVVFNTYSPIDGNMTAARLHAFDNDISNGAEWLS